MKTTTDVKERLPASAGSVTHGPRFKVGDLVRFRSNHPDVPKTPFRVVEARPDVQGHPCVCLGAGCWYGEEAFELDDSELQNGAYQPRPSNPSKPTP